MRATLRLSKWEYKQPKNFKDSRYPLTNILTETFGGYIQEGSQRRIKPKKSFDRHPGKRVEVVSEQLCDDVLGYMAPSLEPYKGCTIIDVHPGACLWSSKLHDFLKPKRHVLMEPEMRYYDEFVKPLLDKPDSAYRHTTLIGAHAREYWDNYHTLLNDEKLVSDRPALMRDDPKLRKLDTSILLTGNLWRRYPIRHKSAYTDHTLLLMQHMTYAALTNEIFQRSGLVRMLWWVPDTAKSSIFPSSVRSKRSYDLGLQMGANIEEVAGVARAESLKRAKNETPRAPTMDASVAGRVQRSMEEHGWTIPAGREFPLEVESPKVKDDPHVHNSVLATTCTTTEDLKTAIEEFTQHLEQLKPLVPTLRHSKIGNKSTDKHADDVLSQQVRYKQCIAAIATRSEDMNLNSSSIASVRTAVILDTFARLLNLEANYAAVRESKTKPSATSLASLHSQILAIGTSVAGLTEANAGTIALKNIYILLDDIVTVESSPPILHRDRRSYEPLRALPEEFWPQYDLTLLDITPHEPDLSSEGIADRTEGAKVCQELLKHLYNTPSLPITAALDRVAPCAAQDLVPEVPAITDARKGGRLNAEEVKVRMLTPEMVEGIVRAFLEWPFRPSLLEMTLAMGERLTFSAGQGGGVDGEEGDGEDVPEE